MPEINREDRNLLLKLMDDVAGQRLTAEEAAERAERALSHRGYDKIDCATVDLDRLARTGLPETIFGASKTPRQIAEIARRLYERGQRVLATRVESSAADETQRLLDGLPVRYDRMARCLIVETAPISVETLGRVLVVCAGTSDLPVAAEAAEVARFFGNDVALLNDVGVAGIHRLLDQLDIVRSAAVLIVCAGMEGALPSVVAGLVSRPVIAVPTSVGYGAHFGGVAALLGMLNSCAPGITVVNIDNGFGAACAATLMNRPMPASDAVPIG